MRNNSLAALAAVACAAAAARGDFLAEVWGNRAMCHHQGTFRVDGQVAQFDLSALAQGTAIHRAVLRAMPRRSDYRATIEIYPLAPDQDEAPPGAKMLALRPPWYNTFDATDAVRSCVAKGEGALRLHMKVAPGWRPEETTLEVAYDGTAKDPTPAVTRLRAVHHDGQTFLTWKEHEDILADCEAVTLENIEKKLLPLRGNREVAYRVYASDAPITAQSLGQAALIAEVPFVVSMYYLDSVRTIEHPNRERGEGPSPLVGGARARRDPVPPYVIAKGEEPLPRGSGLYVRTITRPGKTYYAVVTALNGREAVGRDGLSAANSLRDPVAEQPAPPIPVLQSYQEMKHHDKAHPGWTISTYNYWLEFPYANVPRQLAVATRQLRGLPPGERGELCVNLGSYGSQPAFIARERGGGTVTLCPPWDQDDSILQGRHECLDTLRSYDQGVVHNWAQRRTLALVEWAKREFPVDPNHVTLVGQFALWGLRHPEVFATVISDAYGNFNKGREAQKHGFSWGPYPLGSKNWLGIDQWDHMNVCKWIRDNPKVELPYLVLRPTGASHVGDIGPWAWPELYRALHDTKRAFTARHGGVWSGAPLAGTLMPDKIRRNQSLPAFANCSLDGMPGDGDMSNNGGVGADCDVVADLNGWLLWDTDTIVDEPDRWEITAYLYAGDPKQGRPGAPADTCTADLTPRRCQKFAPMPGQAFQWTNTSLADNQATAGKATADHWGLVTLRNLTITKGKNRIVVSRASR